MVANRCKISTEMCTVKTISVLESNKQDVAYRMIYSPRYQVTGSHNRVRMRNSKWYGTNVPDMTIGPGGPKR